jgi:hypothetical protein
MGILKKRELVLVGVASVLAIVVVSVRVLLPKPALAQFQRPPITFDATDYDPQTAINPFDPIIAPPFVSAEEVKTRLSPNELVLGVEIDGLARAYPINMLTGPSREIFNDTLGENKIAATW